MPSTIKETTAAFVVFTAYIVNKQLPRAGPFVLCCCSQKAPRPENGRPSVSRKLQPPEDAGEIQPTRERFFTHRSTSPRSLLVHNLLSILQHAATNHSRQTAYPCPLLRHQHLSHILFATASPASYIFLHEGVSAF